VEGQGVFGGITGYVDQGLTTRTFSVPKNPKSEHVIPKAFGISSVTGSANIKKIPHLGS
jgi:hypothetical protein